MHPFPHRPPPSHPQARKGLHPLLYRITVVGTKGGTFPIWSSVQHKAGKYFQSADQDTNAADGQEGGRRRHRTGRQPQAPLRFPLRRGHRRQEEEVRPFSTTLPSSGTFIASTPDRNPEDDDRRASSRLVAAARSSGPNTRDALAAAAPPYPNAESESMDKARKLANQRAARFRQSAARSSVAPAGLRQQAKAEEGRGTSLSRHAPFPPGATTMSPVPAAASMPTGWR